jgi:hypothetical protein
MHPLFPSPYSQMMHVVFKYRSIDWVNEIIRDTHAFLKQKEVRRKWKEYAFGSGGGPGWKLLYNRYMSKHTHTRTQTNTNTYEHIRTCTL